MADIRIDTPDGSFTAYLAEPERRSGPGVVVIQEIFGVNAAMRKICDDFAAQGCVALCPDLFWRQEPGIQLTDKTDAEWQRAFALMNGFDQDKGIQDLAASLDHLRGMEGCNGRVGCIGYCLGGRLAFMMAARTDVDCSVSYYGVGLDNLLGEVPNIRNPLLMHIAEMDKYVPAEARAKILDGVRGNPKITAHVYEGVDHAFARPDGIHHDAKAAELANRRTAEFLSAHLRGKA